MPGIDSISRIAKITLSAFILSPIYFRTWGRSYHNMVSRLNAELWLRKKDTRNFPQVLLLGGCRPCDLYPLHVPSPHLFQSQVPDPEVLFRHLLAFFISPFFGFYESLQPHIGYLGLIKRVHRDGAPDDHIRSSQSHNLYPIRACTGFPLLQASRKSAFL